MKTMNIAAIALLIAALPIAPVAFASDWGNDNRGHGRSDHARGQHDRHDQHGYRGHRGHHHGHHYRHGHRGYYHHTGHYNHHSYGGQRARIVLPFPPLPPFPVIVLNKKHHGAHVELRRPY